MALKSATLAGSARLDQAAAGGPSVKKGPPHDDPDPVGRIQRALVELGYLMPKSFPAHPAGEPDGIFGPETHATVLAFQKHAFAKEYGQWDGRVGKNTLARMDERLPVAGPDERTIRQPVAVATTSRCATTATPAAGFPGFRRVQS